jgi:hypothetical protein
MFTLTLILSPSCFAGQARERRRNKRGACPYLFATWKSPNMASIIIAISRISAEMPIINHTDKPCRSPFNPRPKQITRETNASIPTTRVIKNTGCLFKLLFSVPFLPLSKGLPPEERGWSEINFFLSLFGKEG